MSKSQLKEPIRKIRTSRRGRAARVRKNSSKIPLSSSIFKRNIPLYPLLHNEALEAIEEQADRSIKII